jgi:hypothetical protein
MVNQKLLVYSSAFSCGLFKKKKLKTNVKSIDIVLEVLLNPIKQFDLETC